MLKNVLTLMVVTPIYFVDYVFKAAQKNFVESSENLHYTTDNRYIANLTMQVEDFYRNATFLPAPRTIDLLDVDCILKVVEDLTLFGKRQCELRDKIIRLL